MEDKNKRGVKIIKMETKCCRNKRLRCAVYIWRQQKKLFSTVLEKKSMEKKPQG